MTSTEIIENAKAKFKELGHKDYEWCSFYNGYLIGCSNAHRGVKKLDVSPVSQQRELLIAFHKFQQNMWSSPNAEITENVVDTFLKSNL